VLVRHGESNVMVSRVIGGHRTCSGLSALGRLQSERLRDRLARTGEISADALYASNYARATETAEILRPAFGGLEVLEEPGFGEHDPGEMCDGMSYDDFMTNYPASLDWSNPYAESFPGGETVAGFHHRVGAAVHSTLERHAGQTVVVACHGGVIDAVMRQFLRIPPTGSFEVRAVNTSLTEFLLARSGLWRLVRYNDAAHLEGLATETAR
jgi:2,3-bisphosphoglycerate-dependent phosphoglycerate mutase